MKKTEDKKKFEEPVADIERFCVEDIVRTSPIVLPLDPFDEYDEDDF